VASNALSHVRSIDMAGEPVFGQRLFRAACHGPGLPDRVALETKYKGAKPALLSERTDLYPAGYQNICT